MPLVCFSNPGEIDLRLVTTLGVNVKETAGAIGHFGTGLKYALATVMRLGGNVTIQSGHKEIEFYTEQENIRGKFFDLIYMRDNGGAVVPLAFTTELGKNWAPWMAYREFLCNAWDEKGSDAILDTYPTPASGFTRVLIEEPALLHIAQSKKDWLLDKKAKLLWKTPVIECYSGQSTFGFYKGIKVVEFNKPTAFTYNVVADAILTEDRTMPAYVFINYIASEVMGRDRTPIPPSVLRQITQAPPNMAERDFYWPSYITPRQEILDAVGVSPNLRQALSHHRPPAPLTHSVFDDLNDVAPFVPPGTCPYINDVQQKLREVVELLAYTHSVTCVEDLKDAINRASEEITLLLNPKGGDEESPLERLRTLNENLRESGIYWRDVAKGLTSKLASPHAKDNT